MLIEELIRLGRPLLEGNPDPQELLRLITDVEDERVKNFYRHVFVVEVPTDGKGKPTVLPMQQFGDIDANGDFHVDQQRAVGAPFVLPSGGNPLNPQGRYGLPVYPCYDRHVQDFRQSAEGVLDFLRGRLERTSQFEVPEELAKPLAELLHKAVAETDFGNEKKILGVVILVQCGPEKFYTVGKGTRTDRVGQGKDGRPIVPNYARILEAVWTAKLDEGREGGTRPGPCSFTESPDEAISPYCKAWPWAFTTWSCPLPNGGDEKMLVEGIALSAETYRALTVGACAFNKLIRRVSSLVIPEIFSPADTRKGKDLAQRRKLTDLPGLFGSALLLPVQDSSLSNASQRQEFIRGIGAMLDARENDLTLADRYLTSVTGFDVVLPEGTTDDFRLTLIYFSGDYSRGDIHLRAYIQEVIPSAISSLRELARDQARHSMALLRLIMPGMSEKQLAYFARCYESVPYLLARAYGGAYLWQELENVLHRRPLNTRRVTANAARRLRSVTAQWPNSRYIVLDEIAFYLSFLNFLSRTNQELAGRRGDNAMPMRPWKELLQLVDKGPVSEMELSNPAELGFACGALIKRFSRMYYVHMKGTKRDVDYLRDRVLTFGTDLRPDAIHDKGLRMILELPNRLKELKRSPDLEERVGATIVAFQQLRDQIEKNKDEFVTAFWAGYALQGFDRPRKPKDMNKKQVAQT